MDDRVDIERQTAQNFRHIERCEACSSLLVEPVDWVKKPDNDMELTTRCPECQYEKTAVYTPEEIDSYEDVLEEAQETLLKALRAEAEERMAADANFLAHALQIELIQPDDFGLGYKAPTD